MLRRSRFGGPVVMRFGVGGLRSRIPVVSSAEPLSSRLALELRCRCMVVAAPIARKLDETGSDVGYSRLNLK